MLPPLAVSLCWRLHGAAVYGAVGIALGLREEVVMTPWEIVMELGLWQKHHPQAVLWGLGALLTGTLALATLGRRTRPVQQTHGSARFATPADIRAAGFTAP